MNRALFLLMFLLAVNNQPSANAETFTEQQRALNLIVQTADSLCQTIKMAGESESASVQGKVDAQVNGLIKKFADLGISGGADLKTESYTALLRADLPTALKDEHACKLKVFEDLQGKMIPGPRLEQQSAIAREIELCDTKNNDLVSENPPRAAVFEIPESYNITYIWTYHFNNGNGVTPGNIALQKSDGALFGPWEVTAANVRQKIDWETRPNAVIPAGRYTIIDSERALWSWSAGSKGMGMAKVKGYPVSNAEPLQGRKPCGAD